MTYTLIDLIKAMVKRKEITHRQDNEGFLWLAADEVYEAIRKHEAHQSGDINVAGYNFKISEIEKPYYNMVDASVRKAEDNLTSADTGSDSTANDILIQDTIRKLNYLLRDYPDDKETVRIIKEWEEIRKTVGGAAAPEDSDKTLIERRAFDAWWIRAKDMFPSREDIAWYSWNTRARQQSSEITVIEGEKDWETLTEEWANRFLDSIQLPCSADKDKNIRPALYAFITINKLFERFVKLGIEIGEVAPKRESSEGWQQPRSAPYRQEVFVRTTRGYVFPACLMPDASENPDGKTVDQWQSTEDGFYPPCWSEGACWESNAEDIASDPVIAWKPIAKIEG